MRLPLRNPTSAYRWVTLHQYTCNLPKHISSYHICNAKSIYPRTNIHRHARVHTLTRRARTTYTLTSTSTQVQYVHVHMCMYICTCAYVHLHLHICIHTHTYTHVHVPLHLYAHMYMCMYSATYSTFLPGRNIDIYRECEGSRLTKNHTWASAQA